MALSRMVFFRHHDQQVPRFHHDKRIFLRAAPRLVNRVQRLDPLLARRGGEGPSQVAVRRPTTRIAHRVDPWRRDQGRQLL